MLTDALSKGGLNVPKLEGQQADELKSKLFPGAAVGNPIDILATGTPDHLGIAIDYCEEKFDDIDAILVIFGTPGLVSMFDAYEVLHQKMLTCKKPLFPVLPSLHTAGKEVDVFLKKGHVNFSDEVTLGTALTRIMNVPQPAVKEIELFGVDIPHIRKIIDSIPGNGYIEPSQVQELLRSAGIPVVPEFVSANKEEILAFAHNCGFPVVAKVVGPVHKSDIGGVALNIKSAQHLALEFERMMKLPDVTAIMVQPMAKLDPLLAAITPAMREGSGMVRFAKEFPTRYFDVGIAEQHAVTFAAGLACDGMKPVVAIYSTFLQRAYDQLIHDVSLQNLPVLFAIDRAGLVGADGPTHAGVFDISFLRCIPNMTVMTPSDENECRQMLYTGFCMGSPAAVRYPRGVGPGTPTETIMHALPIGRGLVRRQGQGRVAILAFGSMLHPALEAAEALDATVADMRFVKPLDRDLLAQLAQAHDLIVTIEENVIMNRCFSRWLLRALLLLSALACQSALAVNQSDLLSPDKAFASRVIREGDHLVLTLDVAEGYYVYRDRIVLSTVPAGLIKPAHFPAGKVKNDPYFGKQVIFQQQNRIEIPLLPGAPQRFTLNFKLQGCAAVGVCYPPFTRKLNVGDSGSSAAGWMRASNTPSSPTPGSALPLTLFTFFLAGLGMPITVFRVVVLPAPFAPIKVTSSP